jgi:hypothetical protein
VVGGSSMIREAGHGPIVHAWNGFGPELLAQGWVRDGAPEANADVLARVALSFAAEIGWEAAEWPTWWEDMEKVGTGVAAVGIRANVTKVTPK